LRFGAKNKAATNHNPEKRWNMTADVTLGRYDNRLTADETRVLSALDHQVVHVLYLNNVHARPEWYARTDAHERLVQCVIADPEPRVLLELPSSELNRLSADELLARLEDSLRQF
jgi:hypothetical protein